MINLHRSQPPAHHGRRAASPGRGGARAFTITELLIVIAIIVLVLAMAVPAFNAITGNKSEAAMINQIGALLGRARTEAVGVQQMRGVMFYFDPADGSYKMTLVKEVPGPYAPDAIPSVLPLPNVDAYLDLTSNSDVLTLPAGVGVQTIGEYDGTPRRFDTYIGYNIKNAHNAKACNDTFVRYGGVILFDARGELVSRSYALRTHSVDPAGAGKYTPMGLLLYGDSIQPADTTDDAHDDLVPVDTTLMAPSGRPLYMRSQIGLAVFPLEEFTDSSTFTQTDAQITAPGSTLNVDEIAEEQWINEHATLALVNRYNGSLMKGE